MDVEDELGCYRETWAILRRDSVQCIKAPWVGKVVRKMLEIVGL